MKYSSYLKFLFLCVVSLFFVVTVPSTAQASTDWPVFQKDPNHTGYNVDETLLEPPFSLLWTFLSDSSGVTATVDVNGTLFAKFNSGVLYAIDDSSGAVQWQAQTGNGGPLAFENNKVYTVAFCSSCGTWTIEAYNASTGVKVWTSAPISGGVTVLNVLNDVVYLGTADTATGGHDWTVRALDAINGQQLWYRRLDDSVFSVPAVADGKIWVGAYQSLFYNLNATDGSTIWQTPYSSINAIGAPSVVNNVLYQGSAGGGPLYALNASTGGTIWTSSEIGGVRASVAVANGVVYVTTNTNNVYAFNASTGSILWQYATSSTPRYPIIANHKLLVGSDDGKIYAFSNILPNEAPVINDIADASINAGDTYSANGSFTDADSTSWSATVNYGDGSGEQSLLLNGMNFALSHQYTSIGEYTVTVKVTDNQSAIGTETATVTVNPALPVTVTFNSAGDTYLRSGEPNRNQGAGLFMRLQANGNNRSMVRFDQATLESAIGNGTVLSAKLRLTITDNGNNWGTTGRPVDLHRLLSNWAEGNGTENDRGTGSGATWNCATDSNISNQNDDCSGATAWEMNNSSLWSFASAATATTTITNNQSGVVELDVTSDVQSFMNGSNQNYGWLLKKTNEGQAGQVSFGTKESSSIPQLVVTYQP